MTHPRGQTASLDTTPRPISAPAHATSPGYMSFVGPASQCGDAEAAWVTLRLQFGATRVPVLIAGPDAHPRLVLDAGRTASEIRRQQAVHARGFAARRAHQLELRPEPVSRLRIHVRLT